MKTIKLSALLVLFSSIISFAQEQILDSTYTYMIDEKGKENLAAKAYWNLDKATNTMHSEYFIFNTRNSEFKQVNTQKITYYKDTKSFQTLVTKNFDRQAIDSIYYTYNEDGIYVEDQKYSKSYEGEYGLVKTGAYLNLDKTNRKQIEKTTFYNNRKMSKTVEKTFDYVYDEDDNLLEKVEYLIMGDQKIPKSKQVQQFYDDGQLKSVKRFYFDQEQLSFMPLFYVETTYDDKVKIKTKTNYKFSETDPHKIEIKRITYLTDKMEQVAIYEMYLMELTPENLVRRTIYFYSN
jgi:hypothetical protein